MRFPSPSNYQLLQVSEYAYYTDILFYIKGIELFIA